MRSPGHAPSRECPGRPRAGRSGARRAQSACAELAMTATVPGIWRLATQRKSRRLTKGWTPGTHAAVTNERHCTCPTCHMCSGYHPTTCRSPRCGRSGVGLSAVHLHPMWRVGASASANVRAQQRAGWLADTAMNEFEQALAEYRAILAMVAGAATTATQERLCNMHVGTLEAIERCYAATGTPESCRGLILSDRALHEVDILRGDAAPGLRAAYDRLLQLVSA